ncbi:unnamed protein product [Arctogadus glacialis]
MLTGPLELSRRGGQRGGRRAVRNVQTRPPPPPFFVCLSLWRRRRFAPSVQMPNSVPQCRGTASEEVMQGDWMSSALVTRNRCALGTLGVS